MSAYLAGFGRYLPSRVVTNAELAARFDKAPEWIENASGIRERRYAEPDESIVDMGVAAAQHCGFSDVGFLLVASGSGARGFPGPASAIAYQLGLTNVPALDIPIASAGSLFGLALALRLAGTHGNVLLIASEKMSDLIGDDPNTAILFGDGAGAALITPEPSRWRLVDAVLHSDGQFRDDLAFDGTLKMNGMSVIMNATRKMPAVIGELLKRNQMAADQVNTFLVHQANANVLARVAKALNTPAERFFSNIARYGNTSSASMLIAASEWSEQSELASDSNVVFCAFGAGFHWGAALAVPA